MELKDLREILDLGTKGLSAVTTEMRIELKDVPKEVDLFIIYNLCMTSKDAAYDEDVLLRRIHDTFELKEKYMAEIKAARVLPEDARFAPEADADEYVYLEELAALRERDSANADGQSLRRLIVDGLKGVAQYAWASYEIGYEDEGISPFLERVLQRTLKFNLSIGLLFNLAMEVGGFAYRSMGLFDKSAIEEFGAPALTNIELGVRKNPGILVSGASLFELVNLLKQTEGQGVDVYTHDELISAHAYPELKKFDHFAGNYGGSAKDQVSDFENFGGPVVVTGTGMLPVGDSYKDRIYTTSFVSYPGVTAIREDEKGIPDFSAVIEQAKACSAPKELQKGELIAGFGHDQMFKMMDIIEGAIKDKGIDRIITLVGTDGPEEARSYFTDLAKELPKNSAVLATGTAAYRVMNLGLGTVHGLPRVLVAGQLVDTYSVAMTALKLQADLEKYDLNGIPMTYLISLYDEKSMSALLAMTYVGAKNLIVGPEMPSYMTESIVGVFKKNFGIRLIGDPSADVEEIFAHKKSAEGQPIDANMLIIEIIETYPDASRVLMDCGMSCVTCGAALYESLAEACQVHGLDPDDVQDVLNHELGLVDDDE